MGKRKKYSPNSKSSAQEKLLNQEFSDWTTLGSRLIAPVASANTGNHTSGVSLVMQLIEGADNSPHMLSKELELLADSTIVFSVLARPSGRQFLGLWLRGPQQCDDMIEVFFDISKGLVTARTQYGKGVLINASIDLVSDGWVHCSIGGIPSPSGGFARANILVRNSFDGSSRYPGDDCSGISLKAPTLHFNRE